MRTTAITLLSSLLLLLFLGESTATGPSFLRRLGGALNDIVRDDNVVLHDDPLPRLHNAIRQYHADRDLSTTPLLMKPLHVPVPRKYKSEDLDSEWGFPTQGAVRDRVWTDMPEAKVTKALERRNFEEAKYQVLANHEQRFPPDFQHEISQELRKYYLKDEDLGETDPASIKVRSPTLAPALDAMDNIILRLNPLLEKYSPDLRDKVARDLIWLDKMAEESIEKTFSRLKILYQYMDPKTTKWFRYRDYKIALEKHAEVSKHAREILDASKMSHVGIGELF